MPGNQLRACRHWRKELFLLIIDSLPLDSSCHKVGDVDGVQKKVIAQGNDGSFNPEKRAEEGSKKDGIAQGDDGFSSR
ncbi:OLC1v1012614C1 [Oldenlandia corymbosa var. corymbosa]|uniref:OLC1v1012614C1 n=1 Tax=Oldenlandia corymbosa var. corymbosa TaxID=529605 RepID=A0AAV1DZI7_OLDCO|nr:OLC1v1012614C1 [Oldenlandia corymbosa var. corymbosa]